MNPETRAKTVTYWLCMLECKKRKMLEGNHSKYSVRLFIRVHISCAYFRFGHELFTLYSFSFWTLTHYASHVHTHKTKKTAKIKKKETMIFGALLLFVCAMKIELHVRWHAYDVCFDVSVWFVIWNTNKQKMRAIFTLATISSKATRSTENKKLWWKSLANK